MRRKNLISRFAPASPQEKRHSPIVPSPVEKVDRAPSREPDEAPYFKLTRYSAMAFTSASGNLERLVCTAPMPPEDILL